MSKDDTETEVLAFRANKDLKRRIDRWRGSQEDVPGRAEAIRRLLEAALYRSLDERAKASGE